MSWNWLGWLLWILAIAFLWFVIHYIRVQQLMLIAKTKKRFDGKLFTRYVVLVVVAVLWLGGLITMHFMQPVDYNDHQQVWVSTKYQTLTLHNSGSKYYYVQVRRATSGKRPVVSYTYWTNNDKYTVSSRYSSVFEGNRLVPVDATSLPWNHHRLAEIDRSSGNAYAAVMTAHYRNTIKNGLGLHANHVAATYTAIKVPSTNMIVER